MLDVVAGRFGGRSSDAQTSFFLNVGAIGAQFEGVAAAVYHSGALVRGGRLGGL